jgi:prepilin-type N-terminal cleavage/methylation domain-containing protein
MMPVNSSVTILLMRRKSQGFSLAELLIAMFVLVVGIAGVTSSIWWGVQKADSGQYLSDASNYARVLMESVVLGGLVKAETVNKGLNLPSAASGLNDGVNDRVPIFDPPTVFTSLRTTYAVEDSAADIDRFRRNISTVRLAAANSKDSLGGNHYSNMFRITVRVFWQDGGTVASDLTRFNRQLQLETVENI